MCIIFYNETGKTYDKEQLSIAYDNNPHGVGLMWVEDGKIQTLRGLFSKQKMFDVLGHFDGVPHALHLRWRTRGKIDKSLCHPFRASHTGADKSVFMMHNGTFLDFKPAEGLSDTHVFAHKMQDVTSEYGTDMLFCESFLRRVEKNIQSFNKVIFLRSDGKVAIMNPESWTVIDGVWLSNTYSLEDGYRKRKTAGSILRKWKGKTSSGKSSKGVSSAQSGKGQGSRDWMAKSQAWEESRKGKSVSSKEMHASCISSAQSQGAGDPKVSPELAEMYELAYAQREDELGRKLSKKEMKKVRQTVRRGVQRQKAEAAEERAQLQKKAWERMMAANKNRSAEADSSKGMLASISSAQSSSPREGSVVRRRTRKDGTIEILPITRSSQLN